MGACRLCDGVCQALEKGPSSQPWYRVRIDLAAEHQAGLGAQSCCGPLPGEGCQHRHVAVVKCLTVSDF